MGIGTEVHHLCDGLGYGSVQYTHEENAQKVEDCGHKNSGSHRHAPGHHAGGDCVRRVRPSIDENNAKREQDRYQQQGIGCHLCKKVFHR